MTENNTEKINWFKASKSNIKALIKKDRAENMKYDFNFSSYLQDILIILILTVIVLLFARSFDFLEEIFTFTRAHEEWELDELIAIGLFWALSLMVFSIRRAMELRKGQAILLNANTDLLEALDEIKRLKGILPICASCKKIRDDHGYWHQVEEYVREHSEADFSHGICPECAAKLYPDINLNKYGK